MTRFNDAIHQNHICRFYSVNWQKMLKNDVAYQDLHEMKYVLKEKLDDELHQYFHQDDTIYEMNYPVESYPLKVKSVNFDKENIIGVELSNFNLF